MIDEALSVGDAFFQQKCMRFLRKFRETGTILFVSHDGAAVVNLCECGVAGARPREGNGGSEKNLRSVPCNDRARGLRRLNHQRFPIPPDAPITSESFGVGGAVITQVLLCDDRGNALAAVAGTERVTIRITFAQQKKSPAPSSASS